MFQSLSWDKGHSYKEVITATRDIEGFQSLSWDKGHSYSNSKDAETDVQLFQSLSWDKGHSYSSLFSVFRNDYRVSIPQLG